ncbi:thioesterase domain-containing protein [Shewanella sp. KX20019]|uniref:thioesterase domain-containing protein n=1 Tax=Shewanella sp. KX20019 TaxID=2803864 RepID=UPI0019261149|nr:thioesterase domain-containing protein [Shewanella sp. KX20019]QQX79899.1 thioesterase domain-containing protein [Shewanella sp. KX20019]
MKQSYDETALLTQLQQTWYQTIPASQFMQVRPLSFTDQEFSVTAPLAPNVNLHQTMFAGSIYTLMTLTGWGMVWLQQQLAEIDGDIVLADAHIRYIAPIDAAPVAITTWAGADLSVLQRGKRARIPLTVELFCADKLSAVFDGVFISLPKSSA